ncbi:hypothetical protein ACFSKU_12495 [Pontibacter silvestris]|uniref:Tetratricopeptide repeat protein n=1 Tax=Pontibacter silvestris TaxID=2305183 RepID=A0ABW4X0M4_9BACT|nr:hypothetical protein [Pontibacter silvestris]MCC9135161.1 hypothetical protein [Pontibacter silvestris]
MANESIDPVFQLVKSLTRSEKRHFRLFANRQGSSEGLKFLQLFDEIDHQDVFNEEKILQQVPAIKKAQLANLKANLYKHLLASLRLYHTNQNMDIQLHEQLDYARVLYNRGFYQQSLKMLEKVKVLAMQSEMPHIALEAINFEKKIESQYITRSLRGRAENLSEEAIDIATRVTLIHQLSNVALRLYGLYLKVGLARNQEEYDSITDFFQKSLPAVNLQKAGFFEKLYYYQSHVWYYTIIQDFKACYRYAQKWVDLFELNPDMKNKQPMLYIKGLHNLLATLYNLLYYSKFKVVLQQLEGFAASKDRRSSPNTEMLLFQYIYTNKLNALFMEGQFGEGKKIIPEILDKLQEFQNHLDPHRVLVFYFKIASLYFGSGDNYKAIEYLNKIIHYKNQSLREDIQCFARILNLIAHYEAGEDEALDYQIRSVYHYLGKMNNQQQMQIEIFRFLRNLGNIAPHQLRDAFIKLKEKLNEISQNPLERRPFLYLDIISWLESKIESLPVQEVMARKFKDKK